MSEEKIQNFENHVTFDPKMMVAGVLYLGALVLAVTSIFTTNMTLLAVAVVLMSIGGLVLGITARRYSVLLQDRIIKTEMRLRLRDLLDSDQVSRIPEYTMSQLVALRFESDENLPDLARKVLDEDMKTAKEIKMLVKDWQADWHRV